MEKDIALVYMVAGISSRFGGKIKQFAKVTDNETLIEYSLNQALKAGFTKIVFIVGNKTEQPFKEMFGDNYKMIPISYCSQKYNENERDKPWGTVDALSSIKDSINCPFVVCNGDDIYGENTFKILSKHLKNKNSCATIGYRLGNVLPENGSVNRGIFQVKNNKVLSVKEELGITKANLEEKILSEESLCSMNIFALYPEVINELSDILIKFKKEHKGDRKIECLLPNELNKLIEQKKIIMKIYKTPDKWFGVTNPEDEEIIKKQLESLNKKF